MKKKREWQRSTQAIDISQVELPVLSAVQAHCDRYNLGSILNNAQACIVTGSTRVKAGLFSGKKAMIMSVVVATPEWLVISTSRNSEEPVVSSARIDSMIVQDFKDLPFAAMIEDAGVQVNGIFTGMVGMHGSRQVTQFIPLGEGQAAERFKVILWQLVAAAKIS